MSEVPPFAWISATDVERDLPYPVLFPAIREGFAGGVRGTPRVSLPYVGRSAQSSGTLLLMSAIQPDSLAGVKIVTYNVHRESGIIKYIYVAFDPVSGALLALIDGEAMNTRRTAAVSVVAAQSIAKRRPARILVLGTGPVARELVKAYTSAYPGAALELWGRRPAAAGAIATDLAPGGIRVAVTEDLDRSVQAADIVSCATGSLAPLLKGTLLRRGAHVDLIGGFTPTMREADDAVYRRAGFVVVDNASALTEAGDLCQPLAAGILRAERIVTLENHWEGVAPTARGDGDLTVFKSVGNSVFDLATAQVLVRRLAHPGAEENRHA